MKVALINRNHIFSALLIVTSLLIGLRIMPVHVDPVISLTISKNRVGIQNIHQKRDIEITKTVAVDVLNLAENLRFKHPKLGEIGYGDDFFVDIDQEFTVKKEAGYHFLVGSDDGFVLSIDGKRLCQFTGSRPINKQTCATTLTEGTHRMQLSYYQGYGNAGLTVEYRKAGTSKLYFVGENSTFMRFH